MTKKTDDTTAGGTTNGATAEALKTAKDYISPNVYRYGANPMRSCHEIIDEAIAATLKALG